MWVHMILLKWGFTTIVVKYDACPSIYIIKYRNQMRLPIHDSLIFQLSNKIYIYLLLRTSILMPLTSDALLKQTPFLELVLAELFLFLIGYLNNHIPINFTHSFFGSAIKIHSILLELR